MPPAPLAPFLPHVAMPVSRISTFSFKSSGAIEAGSVNFSTSVSRMYSQTRTFSGLLSDWREIDLLVKMLVAF
jgi:hypothetical protein